MTDSDVLIGIIGGSGLYHVDNLTYIKTINAETPWGQPSSPITIAALSSGKRIAFLARHGHDHSISPSNVPSRANIAALKSLGVRAIIAVSAVGSLREEIKPGSFVLPTQIIDRTKGIRPASFFEGTGAVAHAMFGDPFSRKLVTWLENELKKALEQSEVMLFTDKTIVCMEGPQFSTRAESNMYRQWGGDLINMSVLPEAKLAREAEISYALVATATDYDSWRPQAEAVTVAEVFKTLRNNANIARHVIKTILDDLHTIISGDAAATLLEEVGSMKYSILPSAFAAKGKEIEKLAFILPEYFRKYGDDEEKT